ncbi:MAG: response regulator transcription factor [bacterium]
MSAKPDPQRRASAQSILIVDDDSTFRSRLARAFTERGFDVRDAHDAESALALANEESPELAVVDLRMPGRSGLELAQDLLRIDPATQVVVLTGYGSIATAIEAMRIGATYYLSKPADVDDILAAFARKNAPPLEPTPGDHATPSLARTEWEHLNRVLTDCGGNISEASRRLAIHRRSLQRKLKKFPPAD